MSLIGGGGGLINATPKLFASFLTGLASRCILSPWRTIIVRNQNQRRIPWPRVSKLSLLYGKGKAGLLCDDRKRASNTYCGIVSMSEK
jgi:hypothetical protein